MTFNDGEATSSLPRLPGRAWPARPIPFGPPTEHTVAEAAWTSPFEPDDPPSRPAMGVVPLQVSRGDRLGSRPDPETVRRVETCLWLLGDVDALADRVDRRLEAMTDRAADALMSRFPPGGERCVSALMRAIGALSVATNLAGEAVDPEGQAQSLGADFYRAGLTEKDQLAIGHALVRAVRDSYTGEWSTVLGSAWSAVQAWLGTQLIEGARSAWAQEMNEAVGIA